MWFGLVFGNYFLMFFAGIVCGGVRRFLFSLDFHLHLVKSVAIHTIDMGLGDERTRVYLLDDAENVDLLDFAAHYDEHFHILLGVPAGAVEQGAAAVSLLVDGVVNLLPLAGEDGELHRLAVGVDNHVGHLRDEEQDDESYGLGD